MHKTNATQPAVPPSVPVSGSHSRTSPQATSRTARILWRSAAHERQWGQEDPATVGVRSIGVFGNPATLIVKTRGVEPHQFLWLPFRAILCGSSRLRPWIKTWIGNSQEWEQEWDAQQNSKLRELKPNLQPWRSSLRRNRQEEVTLCRLRIGHTYATHGYHLRGEEKPMCPRCLMPLAVAHVLLSCPRLGGSRNRYLGRMASNITLRHILGDESEWVLTGRLFSFIRAIELPVIYRPQ